MEMMIVEYKAYHPKQRKRVGNVDIISKLPDSLLHHILSLLPTDLAVSTCILSKRWKDLWMSTTRLDFDNFDDFYDDCPSNHWSEKTFSRLIERVLFYHSSNITSFNLACQLHLNPTLVESWMSAAVQRRVQEISLSFWSKPPLSLPGCLCTSNILKVLKVKSNSNLSLPSMIWLPSLKILHLHLVRFEDDLSLDRLFSGLPHIEELTIAHCKWDNIKNVVISLPTLLTFEYRCIYSEKGCVVKLNAQNLLNLHCRRDLDVDRIDLNTMPSLAHAKVHFTTSSSGVNAKVIQRATNLLGALCFAKSLHLIGNSLEFLGSCCTSKDVNLVPMFVSLTTLEVDSEISKSAASLLRTILQNAPLLESLVITRRIHDETWNCIEFSLRKCYLLSFHGVPADMLFVKFLLRNAKALEEVKLYCSSYLCNRQEKLESIKIELESACRASKCSCVVKFVNLCMEPKTESWLSVNHQTGCLYNAVFFVSQK